MKPHFTRRRILTVLFLLLASSAFFWFLYRYDNKYTQQTVQAVNGLLVLPEEDLEKDPLRYLCRGWAFYPDVLLTPVTYAEDASSLYMNYITIGEYTRFDLFGRRENSHGCGTYALHLLLPEEPVTYALSLPEIFSAYRLYINGKETFQAGNPDPEHYEAKTQRRMITFHEGGEVTILLAVSDYSHFYSGIVYPPAFGTPKAVSSSLGLQMGLALTAAVIAVIFILLALYLGIQRRQYNALLYALLCLAMCLASSYPLYHSLFELSVFPWYGLELAGKYLVTLLVVILHNRICGTSQAASRVSSALAAAFCLFSLFYGLSASYLAVPVMHIFSTAVDLYKVFTAGYLILTAYHALDRRSRSTSFLFYASILYAESYLWDRFLPSYEPIYGGWFPEWGGFAMVLAAGTTLWQDIVQAYAYNLAFAEEHRQVTRQLAMQTAYSSQISGQFMENRRLIHDFRQHLRALAGIAGDHGDTQILEYLNQITQLTDTRSLKSIPTFCRSTALDALLRYYYHLAQEKNISIEIHFDLPDQLPCSDVRLCTVLGNLMENAVEACDRQVCGHRTILLATREDSNTYFLLLENSYNGHISMKNGKFISHKAPESRIGIGLESARKIIEDCGGTIDIYPQAEIFRIGITLPTQKLS